MLEQLVPATAYCLTIFVCAAHGGSAAASGRYSDRDLPAPVYRHLELPPERGTPLPRGSSFCKCGHAS
eukprot:537399-Amphidinium_carterae.1